MNYSPINKTEWETPQDFFNTLDREFNFDWDVCATGQNAKIVYFWDKKENAFKKEWKGTLWMNPPYDRNIALWIQKAYESAQNGATVVCLIQGRSTDTIWWHDYVMKASELRFIKNRLHFKNGDFKGRATISNVIVVFRPFCCGPPSICSINTKGERIN